MLSPGATIDDRYEIIDALGSGGMGAVYRARRIHLGDEVAIKVMQPKPDAPPESRDRFLRESRACAQLRHPNIVGLLDFGFDSANQPYMVMELLSGPSLKEETDLDAPMTPARVVSILDSVASALQLAHDRSVYLVTDLVDGPSLRQAMAEARPMPWERARNLIIQALDAASALHAKGGFICGVNPEMIRIERPSERIVISSAGIRSVQDVLATMREQELRGQEASANESPYVAPEVLMGGAPNPAADIFTIGVLAYEMLTGTVPFKAASLPELLGQMLQTKPTPPAGEMPDSARAAFLKAIDSMPANRFESADAFARALA